MNKKKNTKKTLSIPKPVTEFDTYYVLSCLNQDKEPFVPNGITDESRFEYMSDAIKYAKKLLAVEPEIYAIYIKKIKIEVRRSTPWLLKRKVIVYDQYGQER